MLADAAAILLLDDRMAGSVEALVWVITDESRFRPEVHQATGMLTVQLGLGVLDAFARLCAAAYADNRTMAQLSRDIVDRRASVRPPADRHPGTMHAWTPIGSPRRSSSSPTPWSTSTT